MAKTLERAKSIDTPSIPAHLALEGTALIYVCKINIERIRTFLKLEVHVFPGTKSFFEKAGLCIIFFVTPPKFKDTVLNTL